MVERVRLHGRVGSIVRLLTWRGPSDGCSKSSVVFAGSLCARGVVSAIVAVCGGAALTVAEALDGSGDSFGVKIRVRWGRCWVHCSL